MNNNELDYVTKCNDAQIKYCNDHKVPKFAPYSGYCFRCGNQIYGENLHQYNLTDASTSIITECKYCNHSFCD